jgi:hypothetical protein
MLSISIWLALSFTVDVAVSQLTTLKGTGTAALTGDNAIPTGPQVTYLTYASTITLSSNGSSTTNALTRLSGGSSIASNLTTIGTASRTTSSATAVNTQPCNGYVEFCNKKYSNITMVAAHNFAFAKKGNAASNQEYGVVDQLNDGIRMCKSTTGSNQQRSNVEVVQAQTHYVNKTMYFCHTSCDLLNAGTVESQFIEIAKWVEEHPYDVVSILIGNGDFVPVGNFTAPIESSGLLKYVYTPPVVPMGLDSWPTLAQMILSQKRVVVFMDYQANQTKAPYILDEFSQLWETPFSPTNPLFPCDQQRPPNLSDDDASKRMYMANHNLNVEATLFGSTLLLPNSAALNLTNAVTGTSSLGEMSNTCKGKVWCII